MNISDSMYTVKFQSVMVLSAIADVFVTKNREQLLSVITTGKASDLPKYNISSDCAKRDFSKGPKKDKIRAESDISEDEAQAPGTLDLVHMM